MVLDFSKIRKEDVLTAGGKGANLGEMVLAGINVPKGFVVTADAYREFLKINGLNEVFEKEYFNEALRTFITAMVERYIEVR